MGKEAIIRNFSRYAYVYDKYADVQKRAALELAEEIKEKNFNKILEIGCGTGNYTLLLREKFRNARLKAIDISKNMIEVAKEKLKDRDIEFIVEDGENLGSDGEFDLITSSACFQWFDDLEKALMKYRDLLKSSGIILFSIFGPSTFWELDAALKDIFKDRSVGAAGFMAKEELGKILNKNFKEIKIRETRYNECFFHLKSLLDKIKYTGIRGEGANGKISFSRKWLNELEDVYLDKFSAIKATYQVFFCMGLKK